MMTHRTRLHAAPRRERGFTIIEGMIVLAIAALLMVLAAPSLKNMIDMQRLRGTLNQYQTDVQYMRSEAVNRQEMVGISFNNNTSSTCYVVHTCGTLSNDNCVCDCTATSSGGENGRCTAPMREIRTVTLPRGDNLTLLPARVDGASFTSNHILFDPTTGAMYAYYDLTVTLHPMSPATEFWSDVTMSSGSTSLVARTKVGPQGRMTVCTPGSAITGMPGC